MHITLMNDLLLQSCYLFVMQASLVYSDSFYLEQRSPNYPDFKHKDTGEALWVEGRYNPPWVKSQLSVLDSKMESFNEQSSSMNVSFMNADSLGSFQLLTISICYIVQLPPSFCTILLWYVLFKLQSILLRIRVMVLALMKFLSSFHHFLKIYDKEKRQKLEFPVNCCLQYDHCT